jgi:hypothetical protein
VANKSKKQYFNYVTYAAKLNSLSNEELQDEMEHRKTAVRMCEQELRLRRNNARVIRQVKQWADRGTEEHNTVASE